MKGSDAQHETKHVEIQNNPHHKNSQHKSDGFKQEVNKDHKKVDHHKGHSAPDRRQEKHHQDKSPNRKISVTSPTHPIRPRAGTLTRKDTSLSGKHSHKEDRMSTGSHHNESEILMENNYKTEPECVFEEAKSRKIIYDTLKEHLVDKIYDPTMNTKCCMLSEKIRDQIRELSLSRFKIVCVVTIGERKEQSMLVTSRCLWNQKYDNFVSATYKHKNLCAIGMVFVAYAE